MNETLCLRNPVIGVRSFGKNTNLVSQMTATQVTGYQEEGIIATAKHFPGHGDTETDSQELISKKAYQILMTQAEELIRKW